MRKLLFILINCMLSIILLSLGDLFIMIAFLLSEIDIVLIPILFQKESCLMKAGITFVLMILLSILQLFDGYFADDGAFLFMSWFTVILTVIPMMLSEIVYIIIYVSKILKTKMRYKTIGDNYVVTHGDKDHLIK